MKEAIKMLARFCNEASDDELLQKLAAIEQALKKGDEEIRAGLVRAAEMIREELAARQELRRLHR
ncbi:MAG: hypothetical protein DI596_06100 [Azospira oryzae]|uniref:Uncharacterized protein n=1 Tax=Pelomicrobium methylotrophicum TaxID=2602750 RepID=A0A5C7EGZ1_9PROT|nr:hypothetical protein [Pelomicrobium methylotrophicum]PZP60222.1 MAG: hypothetical protein DI596_06100 [Azospira oryzae]PZP80581.1 MAG: hypothetical protein DI593_06100 [Azospira oryzae]TXF11542.1 hypothetical protein FR698_09365 [Pelomicrobium methylotrophicum]